MHPQLSGKEVGKLVSRLEAVEARLAGHALWASASLLPGLVALQHKQALAAAARAAKKELKAAQGMVLADELKSRMRVLRRLGYLDPGGCQHSGAAEQRHACMHCAWLCGAAVVRDWGSWTLSCCSRSCSVHAACTTCAPGIFF
jgi:hypothetical protein